MAIRCSQLNVAERCGLAPALAERYPETSGAAERGTGIHEEIAHAWRTGTDPISPEARAAVQWLRAQASTAEGPGPDVLIEQPIQLRDPETGAILTQGTADVVIVEPDGRVHVVDWKTGDPAFVAPPEDNLQTLAYGLGAAMAHEAQAFTTALGFLDGEELTMKVSPVTYTENYWWPIYDRVRGAAARKPEASPGPHCARCWQRRHCGTWMLPAHAGPTEIAPFSEPGAALTSDLAVRGLRTVQAMREACDLIEQRIRTEVRAGLCVVDEDGRVYGPAMQKGRRTADAKAIEAAGLTQYLRQGEPFETWRWKKT